MPRHLLALALGTLSLGIAEFSMMSILSNVAESLAVSIPEAGHFISAYALGVCAGVAVMVVAARGIALSRMLYIPKSRSKRSRYSSENDVLIEKSVKYTDFFLLSIVYV